MSQSKPPEGEKGPPPGDSIILPTKEERRAEKERQEEQQRYETENAYKQRQIDAADAANDLARTNRNLTVGVIILSTVTAAASWYQGRMNWHNWQTSNSTLQQMKDDAAESSRQFQAQLAHFDAGLGRTGLLAIHAGEQAVAAKNAATAARSAANTAKDTLHISQRAYISLREPRIDSARSEIRIKVLNSGHIPAENGKFVYYQATFGKSFPMQSQSNLIDGYQSEDDYPHIPNGELAEYVIPIHVFNESDISQGRQQIIFAGIMTYHDGFPDSPERMESICGKTPDWVLGKKVELAFAVCDPNVIISQLKGLRKIPQKH